MASPNPLNVYKGPDSLKKYFNPDSAPPLPLVEIPECLNPFRRHGVHIYAKMMSMHPANNVKAMPALNLLENSIVPDKTKSVIEYSSGSTVISMSLMSRVYHGIDDVRAFVSNKTPRDKLRLLQFFGLDVTLFGGPSQPDPTDIRGGIQAAKKLAQESDAIVNPNQYENDANWTAHIQWTGPQIHKQLPEINLICAGMGTSGTMTGLGTYFKKAKPSVFRLGVCTAAGQRVPGPRSFALLAPVLFPWKKAIDHVEHVGCHDSFSLSLDLCRQGIVCGPSSGFNLTGLFQFLQKRQAEGTLGQLSGPDGEINCVFICCDLPYQYVGEYFDKLGPEKFKPIKNESLVEVDLHRYDDGWERKAAEIMPDFYRIRGPGTGLKFTCAKMEKLLAQKPGNIVIDLRQPVDFEAHHLPGALNIPIAEPNTLSPFSDPDVLSQRWRDLESMFGSKSSGIMLIIGNKHVLVICYDGDTARVATSVLRAKDVKAVSLRHGWNSLRDSLVTDCNWGKQRRPPLNLVSGAILPVEVEKSPRSMAELVLTRIGPMKIA